MAANVQIRQNGKAQLRVTHRLLPRPFFFTFDSEPEALAYGAQLNNVLQQGVVPSDLLSQPERAAQDNPSLVEMIGTYSTGFPLTDSDRDLLDVVVHEVVGVRLDQLTFRWANQYVADCKRKRNLAPGTIRKRVGALARVVDWHLRNAEKTLPNPFRLLPRGYSVYSREDTAHVPAKHDEVRDRRMAPGESERIDSVLAGHKREGRERALGPDPQFELLYLLIVWEGLRLKEAYTARVEDCDFTARTMRVRGSKGHRGKVKFRTVPLRPEVLPRLQAWCEGRQGLLFDYWNEDPQRLRRVGANLSSRFRTLFEYAQVPDFKEHDLRHEATCRWVLLRDSAGRWAFSEIEICRMMGWSDPKMMMRYASLRGEDLSARLTSSEVAQKLV